MSAPQQPNPQETLDNIVAHYLKKKGYARAEQVFREEARVQSIEALAANAHLLADLNVANYVMFYNPAEQHPRIYNDSYRELRKWVDQSLDMFQVCCFFLAVWSRKDHGSLLFHPRSLN
jgi:hypothetical protein